MHAENRNPCIQILPYIQQVEEASGNPFWGVVPGSKVASPYSPCVAQVLFCFIPVRLLPAVSSICAEYTNSLQFTRQTGVLPSAPKMVEKQMSQILFLPLYLPSAIRVAHLGRTDCVKSNSFQSLLQLSGIESNNEIAQERSLRKEKNLKPWKVLTSGLAVSIALQRVQAATSACVSQETFSAKTGGIPGSWPSAIASSHQCLAAFAFL